MTPCVSTRFVCALDILVSPCSLLDVPYYSNKCLPHNLLAFQESGVSSRRIIRRLLVLQGQALEAEVRGVPHAEGRDRPHGEGPAPKRKREERFAWDADKLVDPSGMELSFEEVRSHRSHMVICI